MQVNAVGIPERSDRVGCPVVDCRLVPMEGVLARLHQPRLESRPADALHDVPPVHHDQLLIAANPDSLWIPVRIDSEAAPGGAVDRISLHRGGLALCRHVGSYLQPALCVERDTMIVYPYGLQISCFHLWIDPSTAQRSGHHMSCRIERQRIDHGKWLGDGKRSIGSS